MIAWLRRFAVRRLTLKIGIRLRKDHGNHLYYPLDTVLAVCGTLGIHQESERDAIAMFAEPDEASVHLSGTREARRLKLIGIIFRKKGAFAENLNSNCFHDPDNEVRAGLRALQNHPSPGDQSGINDTLSSNAFSGPGG